MMNQTETIQEDREKLEQILSRDEFTAYLQEEGRNPIMEWLARAWQKLLDLFPEVSAPPGTSKVLAYVFVGILFVILAGAIVWLIRSMLVQRRDMRRGVFLSDGELEQTSDALLRDAERFALDGNYAEAVRCRFLALILVMDERGWVRAEKWKTNYEYRDELGDRQPQAVAAFSEAARLYERVYYGRGAAGEQEYKRMKQLSEGYWREEAAEHAGN